MNKTLFILLLTLLSLNSCHKPADDEHIFQGTDDRPVYYLSNEGAFGFGNASLSIYYPEAESLSNHVFKQVNGRTPGDVMQSLARCGDTLFLVMNASNKIEVVDASSIQHIRTLQGITGPRYLCRLDKDNLALSTWGGGMLYRLSLDKLTFTDSLALGAGPEQMTVSGQKLYVCNSGGFTRDSSLSVVDISSFRILQSLVVGDNPTSLVRAGSHALWVLCRGHVSYDASWNVVSESAARLVLIDTDADSIVKSLSLPAGKHPAQLEITPDNSMLVYGGGYGFSGLWRYHPDRDSLESAPFIDGDFYGFSLHPLTGDIYALESPVFTVEGKMKIYSPQGVLQKTFTTGIGPNRLIF